MTHLSSSCVLPLRPLVPFRFAALYRNSLRLKMSRNHIQQANQIEMIENSSRIKLAVCLLLAFPLCAENVRLSSLDLKPYETLNFVAQDRSQAVVFVFQLKDGQAQPVRPQGLDAAKRYSIHELNPAPGR